MLIHAAAGGVGMAAVQLAGHSAPRSSPPRAPPSGPPCARWAWTTNAPGLLARPEFAEKFLDATDGRGVDVVLNSLANELVDASLRLLPQRRPSSSRWARPTSATPTGRPTRSPVCLQAFDLPAVAPERVHEMLVEVLDLFGRGVLTLPPITTWDVRRAPDAFRFLSQARQIGKMVFELAVPSAAGPC